jgi:hypothetical protein
MELVQSHVSNAKADSSAPALFEEDEEEEEGEGEGEGELNGSASGERKHNGSDLLCNLRTCGDYYGGGGRKRVAESSTDQARVPTTLIPLIRALCF